MWSGRVVEPEPAWQLLKLLDQIHLWAITDFRTFVIEHLRPWHKFCEDNYLLDWDSQYDCPSEYKRRRTCNEDEDLPLPSWVDSVDSKPVRQQIQNLAKQSLAKAIREHDALKGKSRDGKNHQYTWTCLFQPCKVLSGTSPECPSLFSSDESFTQHLIDVQAIPEWLRASMQTELLHFHAKHDMKDDAGEGWPWGFIERHFDPDTSHIMEQNRILAGKCKIHPNIVVDDNNPPPRSPERHSRPSEMVKLQRTSGKGCTKRQVYDGFEECGLSESFKRLRYE